MNKQNLSLNLGEAIKPTFRRKIIQNIIIDRGSKYTVVGGFIKSKEEVSDFMKDILRDKYFRKATHNTYAYRIEQDNGSVLECKNDDGETGAGNCILRELQRKNAVNIILVVTRYFGGTKLQSDRFKNVINASKEFLEEVK
ncbi:MAG: YigZ family protein [Candidatus Gracilibacteria bacterium]|nr:YigZ family protein [Candidatus Gracilibacteria bacterium]MDQ7023049.1 YigZ family protein [Candidatus Gracilibacteria bacterium]